MRLSPNQIVLILLPLLFASALGMGHCTLSSSPDIPLLPCQHTFSVFSQDLVCVGDNCTLDFNIQVTIGLLGQTACLHLLNENNDTISIIQITYSNHLKIARLQYEYVTSSWDPICVSKKICFGNVGCQTSTSCPNRSTPIWGNEFLGSNLGPVANEIYNEMSISGVLSIPNGDCTVLPWRIGDGCGALNSGDSCLWSFYDMVPSGDEYSVFSIDSTFTYPVLTGAVYRPGVNCYDSLINVSFGVQVNSFPSVTVSSTSFGNFSTYPLNLILISDTKFVDSNFNNKKVFHKGNSSLIFFGPGSEPNAPILGFPGEIQGPTFSSLRNNSLTKHWPATSVKLTRDENQITCVFGQNKGTAIITSYPSFPMLIGEATYSAVENGLLGVDLSPGPVTIGVRTTNSISVIFEDSIVCPSVTFVSTSGCFSCALGAIVIVSAKSTCTSGVVEVLTIGDAIGGTNHLYINTSLYEYQLTIFPTKANAAINMTFKDKDKVTSISFNGFYLAMNQLDNGTWVIANNATGFVSESYFPDWWSAQSIGVKLGIGFGISTTLIAIIAGTVGAIILINKVNLPPYSLVRS
jgi:hypothetical protein